MNAETPTTSPKPFGFVLMPFDNEFEDVYKLGIKESCEAVGAYCERVDEQIFHVSILERIYNQIAKADFIVADMTGRNPNVFYEVGYAHALGKRTILLTQKADDIPFDLKHFPHIVYGTSISKLRDELQPRLSWCVEHPPDQDTDQRIDIELLYDGYSLDADRIVLDGKLHDQHVHSRGEITIQNVSPKTLESGDFSVAIILEEGWYLWEPDVLGRTSLPDGGAILVLPEFRKLFPGAVDSFVFDVARGKEDGPTDDSAIFRVFTPAGSRDYSLGLRWSPDN